MSRVSPNFEMYLVNHLLSQEDMFRLGYPMRRKQCIYFSELGLRCYTRFRKKNSCGRCGRVCSFKQQEACYYHCGKYQYFADIGKRLYTCCNGRKNSPGCTFAVTHVPQCPKRFSHNGFTPTTTRARTPSVLGLDCEMVYTIAGLEVARVSLVDVYGNVRYNEFVLPEHRIIDYNSRFSGITPSHMKRSLPFHVVQRQLLNIIHRDTILIGHALENDLSGLKLYHSYVIDTSQCFGHPRGRKSRYPLKFLVQSKLSRDIQTSDRGHDSIEDAFVCIELMLDKFQREFGEPALW
ncbi:putative exonuclease GOR [Aethina tumida]|uniref:putative exonuclease GOR n=1 Tax=Aethina tumida TaxID=116153 RepID=UPI00096B3AEE|nr:putative exonuclease GOR [Aethina tumida]